MTSKGILNTNEEEGKFKTNRRINFMIGMHELKLGKN